jgi:ATP-dependent Lon protease
VTDELQVIAKAWQAAGFSMRKLQKIVRAVLETRDQLAMRH